MISPAGFERFLAEAAELFSGPTDPDAEELEHLAARYELVAWTCPVWLAYAGIVTGGGQRDAPGGTRPRTCGVPVARSPPGRPVHAV